MPYTPPSRRSPASSSPNSPSLTRNHSYDAAAAGTRPEVKRSRSAAYLQKHRRSPSLASNSPSAGSPNEISVHDYVGEAGESIGKQPQESSAVLLAVEGNADGEDDRGRKLQIQTLKASLQSAMVIPKRQSSPTREQTVPDSSKLLLLRPPLTPEAIKIAHSRSSSEIPTLMSGSQSSQLSSGDSDEDGLEMRRIPMVRKKSGELVKPALRGTSANRRRPISAPGTPTHPKAVHFNDNIEQVRHFLQVDRPMAVSAGSSPVETYDSETDYPFGSDEGSQRVAGWELKLANFPADSYERQILPVRVEKLSLSADHKSLCGMVACANIAFQKYVAVRFTFDYWKTTSEVAAEYFAQATQAQKADGYDRFQFSIKLSDQANLQSKTMYLCVKYNAGGQEHWDNNFGNNYQVDFAKKMISKPRSRAPPGVMPIPRSRHTSTGTVRLPRPRSYPAGTVDDEEFATSYESPFRLQRADSHPVKSTRVDHSVDHDTARLSNRYDFNSSLHAALTRAQSALGEKSGLKLKTSHSKRPEAPAVQTQSSSADPRPGLNSAEYKDLIQKFCYFGSGGTNTAVVSPDPETIAKGLSIQTQVKDEPKVDSSGSNDSTPTSSASNSPPTPKAQLHQALHDGHAELHSGSSTSSSRSASIRTVSPRLLPYRSPSPAVNSAYQEFPHQGLSVQSAQC